MKAGRSFAGIMLLTMTLSSAALAQGNQGVGAISKAPPPTAMQMGAVDPTGKLKGARLDANGNILTASVPAQQAATSSPLSGSATGTANIGPFTPQLGRPINLTLSGTWSGSAQLMRSVDGGTVKTGLTVGGTSWGSFTANANEPVWTESEAGATFYLAVSITSGTLTYRIAQ